MRERVSSMLALGMFVPVVFAGQPGFTEPRRIIELAAPELAVVTAVHVQRGDRVEAGQVLCELDARSLKAGLRIAEARRSARGDLNAAVARQNLRTQDLEQLRTAHASGYARPDELATAEAEAAIASAELGAVRERLGIAALEHERIVVEIERRRVSAPIDATVIELRRDVGEIVTPADHVLLVLAVLDTLVVRLNVDHRATAGINDGDILSGRCGTRQVQGIVTLAAPVIDAATGTIELELEIANQDQNLLSGMACEFDI